MPPEVRRRGRRQIFFWLVAFGHSVAHYQAGATPDAVADGALLLALDAAHGSQQTLEGFQ